MSEVIRQANARIKERTELLGEHALSTIPQLVAYFAPKGYDIIHLAGVGAARIDERGSVHFTPPVRAAVREKAPGFRHSETLKVITLDEESQSAVESGINGNFFVPFITERDSRLHAAFRGYIEAGEGHAEPEMSEAEKAQWDKWRATEEYRLSQPPHHLSGKGE